MEKQSGAREKLITTGMKLLMEDKGEKVSNRMLARAANVNHANINYHFRNREGLNKAILETVLEKWNACFAHILEKTGEAVEQADKSNMEPIVREFVAEVLTVLISEKSSRFLAILFNGKLEQPEQTFRQMFSKVLNPFYQLANKIVAKSKGLDEDDINCIIHGQLIVSQCMTFFRGRVLLLQYKNIAIEKDAMKNAIIQTVSDSIISGLGLTR